MSANAIANTLLELARIQGEGTRQAANIRAQGQANSGQMWGQTLASIGQQIGQIPQQQLQMKLAEQDRQLRGQEIGIRQSQVDAAKAQQTQAQQIPQLIQQFTVDGPNGQKVVDRPSLTQAFAQAKIPVDAQEKAFNFLDGVEKSTTAYRENQLNFAGDQAQHALDFGATPQAVQTILSLNKANGVMTDDQIAAFQQAVDSGQDLKPMLTKIRDLAPKYKKSALDVATLTKEQALAREATAKAGQAEQVVGSMQGGLTADQVADNARQLAQQQAAAAAQATNQKIAQQNADANTKRANRPPAAAGAGGDIPLTQDTIEDVAAAYRILGTKGIPTRINEHDKKLILNESSKQNRALGQTGAQAVQKQAAFAGDAAALRKMQGMAASADAFETKALAQADLISDLSKKVNRTQFPILNSAILSGKQKVFGDKDTQLLFNALDTFTTEYAKIMAGSTGSVGATSDAATRKAEGLISAGLNKGTLQATLDQMKWEMDQTRKGYDATIAHITDRMGGAAPAGTVPPPTSGPKATGRFNPQTGKIDPVQ